MMPKPYEVPLIIKENKNINTCNSNNSSNNNNNSSSGGNNRNNVISMRRLSKPLMEKRRRARINNSLSQLKAMVIDSGKQTVHNQKCKLEKADILELTVKYVQELRDNRNRQQQLIKFENNNSNANNHHHNHSHNNSDTITTGNATNTTVSLNDFVAGFSECAKQVRDYVRLQSETVEPIIITSLNTYLHNCLNSLDMPYAEEASRYGVIKHTRECFAPASPAPSSLSSIMGYHASDMDLSSNDDDAASSSDDMPLNLVTSRPRFHNVKFQMIDECVWRPW